MRTEVEAQGEAAARRLARPGAWLEAGEDGYLVRVDGDRRRRAAARLDEAAFAELVRIPGLKPRAGGGWVLAARPVAVVAPSPGAPGRILGERSVMEADGRRTPRIANLGESPIAWLARRKDAQGRPFLTPGEAAAGERLRDDVQRAGVIGRLTMSWDAGPRGGGRTLALDPAERARAAKDRVRRALDAVGPGLREMLERVCVAETALTVAERELRLPRRSGKAMLKLALGRLAAHYGGS